MEFRCSTCGVSILSKDNFVRFDCPSCGEESIIRCKNCKELSNKYVCSKCNFTGP